MHGLALQAAHWEARAGALRRSDSGVESSLFLLRKTRLVLLPLQDENNAAQAEGRHAGDAIAWIGMATFCHEYDTIASSIFDVMSSHAIVIPDDRLITLF